METLVIPNVNRHLIELHAVSLVVSHVEGATEQHTCSMIGFVTLRSGDMLTYSLCSFIAVCIKVKLFNNVLIATEEVLLFYNPPDLYKYIHI